jgi:hypothetical protein
MSYDKYQNGILTIAQNQIDGEDVESEITRLALYAKMDVESVRQDVMEKIEILD